MKKKIILSVILLLLLIFIWMSGHSDWHLNRNQHNELPIGRLTQSKEHKNNYLDERKMIWVLQPQAKNIFHQPDQPSEPVSKPYPNTDGTLLFDPKQPNFKFLCQMNDGGSYEAILQPNGEYLTEGPKQGTYNYGHPSGIFGSIKHVVFDVIPHFVSANYQDQKH